MLRMGIAMAIRSEVNEEMVMTVGVACTRQDPPEQLGGSCSIAGSVWF